MTDRDFDVHAYDQGYRDGKADAAREIDRLRAALEQIMKLEGEINPMNYDADDVSKLNNAFIDAFHIARAALGDK